MIYPKIFEEKLDFASIKDVLRNHCLSQSGRKFVDKIRFSAHPKKIQKWLHQVNEFKDILAFKEAFPSQDYFDLEEELRRLRIKGTFVDQEKLFELKLSLRTISLIIQYFQKHSEENFPELNALSKNLEFNTIILQKAQKILDEKGEIRDQASSALSEIRNSLRSSKNSVEGTLNKTLQETNKAGYMAGDVSPTVRNGRSVIPVPATHKRQVKGFIHDESSTGQTVYIEPTAVFELNNRIRELESAERREIINILTDFTNNIRPDLDALLQSFHFLGLFDFIRAKAKYALDIEATLPQITTDPHIYLENAYHPILYLHHKKQNKTVVPLNVKLDEKERILVITGPNAGGKTVCLKTVGIIQYMFQCGLLVPAAPDSKLGVFRDIFVNIGDEQSLENDLSTYSSHLQHLNFFVRKVRNQSLFLIDEFGTGTEPQLGGAIAEAVLESLNQKQAFGIITTHYANLKKLADEQEGMMNGAMQFDPKQMKPVFILKTGTPGSSFAFEIAEKMGIPKNILNRAKKKTNRSQVDFDRQLQELETEKRELEKKSREVKVADSFLAEMIEKYENQQKELTQNKNKILREAKSEAKEILSGANKAIENTIREIKENKADKEKTKTARRKLEQEKKSLQAEQQNKTQSKSAAPETKKEIKKGSYVKLKGREAVGEVTHIEKNKVTVAFDSFNFTTTRDELEPAAAPEKATKKSRGYNTIMDNLNTKVANFNRTLDVRGRKAEEVYQVTQQYLDEALLLGIKDIEIVHGKGEGVLRSVVREVLSENPDVKEYHDQHADSGGHGVTVVRLK